MSRIVFVMKTLVRQEAGERDAGVHALVLSIARFIQRARDSHDTALRRLAEFQAAVAAADIPLLIAALDPSGGGEGSCVPIAESDRLSYTVVRILSSNSAARCHALVEAGCVAPLVALLSSTTAEVQSQAAGALCNISADVTSAALIVAHGGAPLLRLPAKHATMTFASVALRNVRAAAEPLRVVGSVDAADSDSVVVAAAALRALPDVTLAAPLPCGALAGASSPPPPPPAVSVAVALCRPRAM